MSAEEDMDYQSLQSSLIESLRSPVRHRSISRRRGRSLNSSLPHNVSRTSVHSTSTPKPTRRASHRSTQSSIIRSSSIPRNEKNGNVHISLPSPIPSSNPPGHSQILVPSLPFDCPSDDEQQQQQQQKQSMSATTRSGKMKKDAILSYFSLRTDGRYDCNICHQPYMAYNGSATNLRRHLFAKHDIAAAAYDSQLVQIKQKPIPSNDGLPILPKSRRTQLDKAIVDCIIDDSLAFTTFTKSGMINLLQTFDSRYEPPSRFTVASRVGDAYHSYIEQVKVLLKQMPAIAFTADIWKSGARKYYISLTAHIFDEEFEVIPLVLSLRQLTGRHLAVNVQAFIMYELDEKFQIMPKQRAGITTDCGSEMVAATTHGLFGPRHACIAHVWNNVVKNGLCLWSPPDAAKFPIDEFDIDDNESIRSIDGDEDDLLGEEIHHAVQSDEEETEENNEQNLSQLDQVQSTTATASTITVVNKRRIRPLQDEFLSEDDEPVIIQPETRSITLVGLLERVFNLLGRCRQLITDIRNIGVVQTYVLMEVGKKGRGFTIDMDIRWNTTYQMIDRLLEHQTLVDVIVRRKFDGLTVCQTNRLKLAALNPDDWDVLRALHQVLTGFDVATTIVSASHYPTLSDSFWAITKLRQILISNIDQSRHVEFLNKTALNYLNMYIEKHLSKGQQEAMLIAAFLDPETHNDMNQDDFSKAMNIVKQKVEKVSTTASLTTTTFLPQPLPTSQTTLSKKDAAKQRMNQLAGLDMNHSNVRSISAAVEISLFTNAIKTKQTFKEFWSTHNQSFPRLVILVRRYCIVPATSVASESAFSIAGFIARKQRSSLSSRTLRHLLVLKYRKNLLKFQRKGQPSLLQDRLMQSLSLGVTGATSV